MVVKTSGNLNVVGEMKELLLQKIMLDPEIMKIVENQEDIQIPNKKLIYKQIVPYKKKMQTQVDAQSIIAFEIVPGEAATPAARDYVLNIWVMVHDDLMRFDAEVANRLGINDRGTRLDVLADKIDYLINGDKSLGFGRLHFEGAPIFDASEYYHGRQLVYTIEGWNRYGDRL